MTIVGLHPLQFYVSLVVRDNWPAPASSLNLPPNVCEWYCVQKLFLISGLRQRCLFVKTGTHCCL